MGRETLGVVREFDFPINFKQETNDFSSSFTTVETPVVNYHGHEVKQHCCQILPPHILEKIQGAEQDLADIKERLRQHAHLHTDARERRAAIGHVPEANKQQLPNIVYTIIDANGNEDFNDDKIIRDVEINAVAKQLLDWVQRTMSFVTTYYKWNGIDNHNMPVKAFFNFGKDFNNAFWDGQQFFCGNGDGQLFDAFSKYIDVIAHELNHGVNQFYNHLVYRDQNGAMDESYADIAGILVKHLFQISQNPRITMDELNGKIGEGLILPNDHNQYALRDMDTGVGFKDHPVLGTDNQPIRMSDYVRTHDDNGGVHTNSGIPNKLFWQIYTDPKFGRTPLERITKVALLFWTARKNVNRSTTFSTWGSYLLDAAKSLYGRRSTEVDIVTRALKVTEIRR